MAQPIHFQNFRQSLSELKEGWQYTEISLPIVPKTDDEAERIKKRGEKSKEVMFKDLKTQVGEALKLFPSDNFLEETENFLAERNFKSFNPKSKLSELVLQVESHIDYLSTQKNMKITINDQDDEQAGAELCQAQSSSS